MPIPVIIGDKEYLEGVNIHQKNFLKLNGKALLSLRLLNQSMGKMIELYNKLHDEGYEAIIDITLSSGISGYNQTLKNIAHNNPEYHLYPYDSKMTVKLQGYLV